MIAAKQLTIRQNHRHHDGKHQMRDNSNLH